MNIIDIVGDKVLCNETLYNNGSPDFIKGTRYLVSQASVRGTYQSIVLCNEQFKQHTVDNVGNDSWLQYFSVDPTEQYWQPIETAPKDGTYILVKNTYAKYVVHWDKDEEWWVVEDGKFEYFLRGRDPTHWGILPE